MQPDDQLSGFVYQLERLGGHLKEAKRWAKLINTTLELYANRNKPSIFIKIILNRAEIEIHKEEYRYEPWISITEQSGGVYYIKPEDPNCLETWFCGLNEAAGNHEKLNIVENDEPYNYLKNKNQETQYSEQNTETPFSRSRNNNQLNCAEIPPPLPPKQRKCQLSNKTSKQFSKQNSIEFKRMNDLTLKSSNIWKTIKNKNNDFNISITNQNKAFPAQKDKTGSSLNIFEKSRDELILLLLELNREKANLNRWKTYFNQQLEILTSANLTHSNADLERTAILHELKDIEGQLKASNPLVKFLENTLRMGDSYGDNIEEYFSKYQQSQSKNNYGKLNNPNREFTRKMEEKQIAMELDRCSNYQKKRLMDAQNYDDSICSNDGNKIQGIVRLSDLLTSKSHCLPTDTSRVDENNISKELYTRFPETTAIKNRRIQLEAELKVFERILNTNENQPPSILESYSQYNSFDSNSSGPRKQSRKVETPVSKRILHRQTSNSPMPMPWSKNSPNSINKQLPLTNNITKGCSDAKSAITKNNSLENSNYPYYFRLKSSLIPSHKSIGLTSFSKSKSTSNLSKLPQSSNYQMTHSANALRSSFLVKPTLSAQSRWKSASTFSLEKMLPTSAFATKKEVPFKQTSVVPLAYEINESNLSKWRSFDKNIGPNGIEKLTSAISNRNFPTQNKQLTGRLSLQSQFDDLMINNDVTDHYETPNYNSRQRIYSTPDSDTLSENAPILIGQVKQAMDYSSSNEVSLSSKSVADVEEIKPPKLTDSPAEFGHSKFDIPLPIYPEMKNRIMHN